MKEMSTPALLGKVEVNETFVGGKTRATKVNVLGMRKLARGPATGKVTVLGMIQRVVREVGTRSRLRAMVVPNHKASSLIPRKYSNVLPGSVLYTDAFRSYRRTDRNYIHKFIDHSLRYVEGRVHTKNIENFWSSLKRTLHGTYIAPRAFHLEAYVDEQMFRFNGRGDNDGGCFVKVLKGADGRRVTHEKLIKQHGLWRLKTGRAERDTIR